MSFYKLKRDALTNVDRLNRLVSIRKISSRIKSWVNRVVNLQKGQLGMQIN